MVDSATSCVDQEVEGHETEWVEPVEANFPLALTWWVGLQVDSVGFEMDWGSPCDSALSWVDAEAGEGKRLTVPFR